MRSSTLLGSLLFIGAVLGAAVPDAQEAQRTNNLPYPEPRCDKTCTCTNGPQPPEGRVYCGYCEGISGNGSGELLYGHYAFKCTPGGCCNYGVLDGRCITDKNRQPDYEKYCWGGP